MAVYIDDLIEFSATWEDCWYNTIAVLQQITEAGLVVNIGKVIILQPQAKVLGHIMDDIQQVIILNPAKAAPLLHLTPQWMLQEV